MKQVIIIDLVIKALKAIIGFFQKRDPEVKKAAEKAREGDLSAINDRYRNPRK